MPLHRGQTLGGSDKRKRNRQPHLVQQPSTIAKRNPFRQSRLHLPTWQRRRGHICGQRRQRHHTAKRVCVWQGRTCVRSKRRQADKAKLRQLLRRRANPALRNVGKLLHGNPRQLQTHCRQLRQTHANAVLLSAGTMWKCNKNNKRFHFLRYDSPI